MTIENERLVEYLGLELELCYLVSPTDAVWIVADKIRRKDRIALEMLRIFNRFIRIGKSLDGVNKRPKPVEPIEHDDPGDSGPAARAPNIPYARCIGVRVRVHEHVASIHVRPGSDRSLLSNARRLPAGALLDPNLPITLEDPILAVLTRPVPIEEKAFPSHASVSPPKRLPKP